MMARLAATFAIAGFLTLFTPAGASAVTCPLGQTEANGTEAADWLGNVPTGRCVTFEEWSEEFKAAGAAHDAQEAAATAAEGRRETLERNKETGGPPTFLRVTPVAHHGYSFRHPGYTSLNVTTNRWAEVKIRITPKGYAAEAFHWKQGVVNEQNEAGSPETESLKASWSCNNTRLVEYYVVTVHGENGGQVEGGPGLTASGHFTDLVSRRWCKLAMRREALIKKQEAREAARRFQREVREQEERERHTAEREAAERQRFEANCRAIGGTPVGIDTSGGPETVCRAQGGGLIPVPT